MKVREITGDRMIGVICRYGFNDYQIMLTEFSDEDNEKLWNIITPYADNDKVWGERGNRDMTLKENNVDYLESDWQPKYRSTADDKDIVTISEIFNRYVQINGTHKGFEEYVNDGFINGNEKEYEEIKADDNKPYKIVNYGHFKYEFPDYDGEFYIPNGWVDNSWYNDVCPHVERENDGVRFLIWQDYVNPDLRECGEHRYAFMIEVDADNEPRFLYETDNINEILELCKYIY